jgi:hypothetical protein
MALTLWTNEITSERLDRLQLDGGRRRARRLYEVIRPIFEDELEALAAIDVVPATGPGAVSTAEAFWPPCVRARSGPLGHFDWRRHGDPVRRGRPAIESPGSIGGGVDPGGAEAFTVGARRGAHIA